LATNSDILVGKRRDGSIAAVLAISCLALASPSAAQLTEAPTAASPALPPFIQRGLPDEFHEALKPLEGKWRATKQIFVALGTPGHLATSDEIATAKTRVRFSYGSPAISMTYLKKLRSKSESGRNSFSDFHGYPWTIARIMRLYPYLRESSSVAQRLERSLAFSRSWNSPVRINS